MSRPATPATAACPLPRRAPRPRSGQVNVAHCTYILLATSSLAAIIIFESNDVALIEMPIADLQNSNLMIRIIAHPMRRSHGDPDLVARFSDPIHFIDRNIDGPIEHLPELCPQIVNLQGESLARLYRDDLHRCRMIERELLKLTPRAPRHEHAISRIWKIGHLQ